MSVEKKETCAVPTKPEENNKPQEPKSCADKPCCAGSRANAGPTDMEELKRMLAMKATLNAQAPTRAAPKTEQELRSKDEWKFWETQPVPQLGTHIPRGVNEPIHENKAKSEVKQECISLPAGFVWDEVDLTNQDQLMELYTLLNENYVEDDDNMFRFDYSPEFLKWALQPSGWIKKWHVGVRVAKNNKLVGFISAVPAQMKVYEKERRMVEINYLCVHKRLRTKRVAPVLIKEITRRCNSEGVFQAVYTAGVIIPSPVSKCRYWHRSLNPKKLIEVKFSYLQRNMTMQRTIKMYRLPEQPKTPGFRKMLEQDCPQAFALLKEELKQYELAPVYSLAEFKHWFLPRENVVDSYVVEQNGKVSDFGSFYHLPSTIMNHPQHNKLNAAYSFHNVVTKTPINDFMNDILISAKNLGLDVFNALDLMNNAKFLEPLKFGIGDGNLQYYVYNWKCTPMKADKVALVLQ